jgi:NADPH-dependent ferric siderophore reductase
MNEMFVPPHQIFRVRRETRRRLVTVSGVEQLTPKMRRIRFASADLRDFASDASDDHIKLIFPLADNTHLRRLLSAEATRPAPPRPGHVSARSPASWIGRRTRALSRSIHAWP